uniref:Aquaporin n=1 Tax=Alexandrium monilatum TaxID=311494 RepID=A0A7S4URC5_9DINO
MVAVNKLAAEFLGTFLLVFTVALNVLTGDAVWGAMSIAAVLAVSIYAMGPVSGGHFNPAVTIACLLTNRIEAVDGALYMLVQVLGAQAAKYAALALLGQELVVGGAAYVPGAFCAELIFTFMLCYVVLGSACRSEPTQYFGLAIGFVIVAGGYAVGGISGGAFNPAVASCGNLAVVWKYVIAECLGAVLAVLLAKAVCPTLGTSEPDDVSSSSLVSKLTSEFVGTFMLVTTVGFNVIGKSPAGALSIGMCLASMIFADGGVSGGNYNPAVTLALLLRGATDAATAGAYVATQLLAGTAASAFYTYVAGAGTALGPSQGKDLTAAGVAELVFTFVLCFVVLGVATVKTPASPQFNGLTVGLCVVAGGNAAGAISGGSLNPAVSLGLFVAGKLGAAGGSIASLGTYILFELAAGALAAGMFIVVFAGEKAASGREARGYVVMPEEC